MRRRAGDDGRASAHHAHARGAPGVGRMRARAPGRRARGTEQARGPRFCTDPAPMSPGERCHAVTKASTPGVDSVSTPWRDPSSPRQDGPHRLSSTRRVARASRAAGCCESGAGPERSSHHSRTRRRTSAVLEPAAQQQMLGEVQRVPPVAAGHRVAVRVREERLRYAARRGSPAAPARPWPRRRPACPPAPAPDTESRVPVEALRHGRPGDQRGQQGGLREGEPLAGGVGGRRCLPRVTGIGGVGVVA